MSRTLWRYRCAYDSRLKWAAQPLVYATGVLHSDTRDISWKLTFHSAQVNGTTDHSITAFRRLTATGFSGAVSEASALAYANRFVIGHGFGGEHEAVSRATAVLQAADGAWYAAALSGNWPQFVRAFSVDTGRSGINSVHVTRLDNDLKAVVGSNAWVNCTDEHINPKLAEDVAARRG